MKPLHLLALLALTAFPALGQDISETIQAGQSITLLATADGVPTPTFEWFRNGVKIAEGPTLALQSITPNDNGTYHAVATNSVGSAPSANRYILTVDDKTPPVFASAPLNQTVREGVGVKLSVVVLGSPAPSLRWRKNGVVIAGATNAVLAFNIVSRTDAGTYDVVATNEKGSATSPAAVIVVEYAPSSPIITRPLSTVVVPKKTDVLLSIQAKGEGLTYQWRKGSANLIGRTSAELFLANVNPSAEGTYTVTVRNESGSASSSAKLFVLR